MSEIKQFTKPEFTMTLQTFRGTQEGQAVIQSQQVFCIQGQLLQGYNGTIAPVRHTRDGHLSSSGKAASMRANANWPRLWPLSRTRDSFWSMGPEPNSFARDRTPQFATAIR